MLPFTVHPVGDCALLAGFTQRIAPEIGAAVAALNSRVLAAKLPGVTETVPAFASLLVVYDPLVTDYDTLTAALQGLSDADGADTAAGEGRLVTIPVCYGGDFGPDLPFVAKHAGLTEAEVIALHTGREYRIYMLGFLPGFPYLGGLDERLFTPRLNTPRTAIPAGAVGIGGEQTGIYPIASPGGWQLIGRTPRKLFDPESGALPYTAGDRIKFEPITAAEFAALAVKEGTA
jgi:inhibitor of KinA